jgi:hypothetical protein
MTDDEREEILRVAFENIAKRDDEAAEHDERRLQNLGRVDHEDERDRFERRRAAQPVRRERGLDTDLTAVIDQRIAAAIAAERETMIEIMAEAIALERADYDAKLAKFEARIEYVSTVSRELEIRAIDPGVAAKLGDDARKLKAEIATLQNCIEELRGTVAAEAQRGSVVDSPMQRYLRDLN